MFEKLIFIVLLFISTNLIAQFSIGVVVSGIGYHPIENQNNVYYKWTIDKKKKLVGFGAISVALSYRLNDYFGIRTQQAFIVHDCAGKFAGVSHFGLELYDDLVGLKNISHELSISIGPLWYYRRNWSSLPGYQNDPKFMQLSHNKVWESKFVWYGGQIEYTYQLGTSDAFALNILPAYPYLYTAGIGLKTTFD